MFKRLTGPQASTLAALRALREMLVSPQDARPLKALQRRGLVRYRRIDGARVAVLRDNAAQVRKTRRERRFEEWARVGATLARV
jgi:hypothetical protein